MPGAGGNTGHPGAQGATGPLGPGGVAGAQGLLGPTGAAGVPGAGGNTGHPGAQGAIGFQGPPGSVGAQGLIGPPGAGGVTGDAGAGGAPGVQGAQGAQGPAGATGSQGTRGNDSVFGGPGPQGAQGGQGFQGANGTSDVSGPSGAPGGRGPQGAQGDAGPTGISFTCYQATNTVGFNSTDVCTGSYGTSTYWYQSSADSFLGTKFRAEANCTSNNNDFAGLFSYMGYPYFQFYTVNSTNGTATYAGDCPTSPPYYSDVNLKTKIETISDALEKILKIESVEYDWNKNLSKSHYEFFEKNKRLHAIGLIAQNVRLYFPEVVSINSEGYYRIQYTKLNSVLVEAIKSQQVFIEDIKEQINELENKLS